MSSFRRLHEEADTPGKAPPGDSSVQGIELLRKARAGDRGAFGQLAVLYNAVLRMIGDREEAAELTQEAFTRALAAVDSFRGESGPYTWLFRIAVNLSISRLRKVHRQRVFSLDRPGVTGNPHPQDQASALVNRVQQESPSAAMEQREQADQVIAALGRIDPEYRAVLIMRDVEGFDYQQMADVLGLPLGTLKSRLFRARIALRDELKAYMNK
jgi:RNA polymerase sigma-70 factor (ECF subfamily)